MTDQGITKQDVTNQSLSLARILDRLNKGTYTLQLSKENRFSPWHIVIWDDSGNTLRDSPLRTGRWD